MQFFAYTYAYRCIYYDCKQHLATYSIYIYTTVYIMIYWLRNWYITLQTKNFHISVLEETWPRHLDGRHIYSNPNSWYSLKLAASSHLKNGCLEDKRPIFRCELSELSELPGFRVKPRGHWWRSRCPGPLVRQKIIEKTSGTYWSWHTKKISLSISISLPSSDVFFTQVFFAVCSHKGSGC